MTRNLWKSGCSLSQALNNIDEWPLPKKGTFIMKVAGPTTILVLVSYACQCCWQYVLNAEVVHVTGEEL